MSQTRRFYTLLSFFIGFCCPAHASQTPLSEFPLGGTVVSDGAVFRVWAPRAGVVSVKTPLNGGAPFPLNREEGSEIFSGQIPGLHAGDAYSYLIDNGKLGVSCSDPEERQASDQGRASILVDPNRFLWREATIHLAPIEQAVIYELHVGSFNPLPLGPEGTFASVRAKLDYLVGLGVNYLELLPVHQSSRGMDWGYDVSSPNGIESGYGSPDDLRQLVDEAHQRGLGVLLDVVHNHYSDHNSLQCFSDGENSAGPYFYTGEHGMTLWGPRPNFAGPKVRDFLASNIRRYLSEYRVDGFRWDAVPYITKFYDYDPVSQSEKMNGVNSDGVRFFQDINQQIHQIPGHISIAEDFDQDPSITLNPRLGGLGFDSRWTGLFNVVEAISQPVISTIDIPAVASTLIGSNQRVIFTENHDEVGHPPQQRRIPSRIDPASPGSALARKRSLLGATILMTTPGIPMLFQGQEFLENRDFNFPEGTPLDWTKTATFAGIVSAYRDLIALRKNTDGKTRPLLESNIQVFQKNSSAKVIAYARTSLLVDHDIVVVANLGDRYFASYTFGLPGPGTWNVRFTSDDRRYSIDFGGTPRARTLNASPTPYDGLPYSASVELAPFTAVVLAN